MGSRCGSTVKWWKWENKWNQEDLGWLPTPGNLFFCQKRLFQNFLPACTPTWPSPFLRARTRGRTAWSQLTK
jgi:hypothetical protein